MTLNKINVPIATAIAGVLFAVSSTTTAVWWASNVESRIDSLERQTKSQWERIGQNTAISEQVSRIDERTATIMEIMKEMR